MIIVAELLPYKFHFTLCLLLSPQFQNPLTFSTNFVVAGGNNKDTFIVANFLMTSKKTYKMHVFRVVGSLLNVLGDH